jgi:hypothetical protein
MKTLWRPIRAFFTEYRTYDVRLLARLRQEEKFSMLVQIDGKAVSGPLQLTQRAVRVVIIPGKLLNIITK